jgi:RNA polymerase sigma factor (sigma-70 family)
MTSTEVETLLKQHDALIYHITKRVLGGKASYHDVEDCASTIRLHFVKSAQQYDPSRAKFSTFIYRLSSQIARRWKFEERSRGVKQSRIPHNIQVATITWDLKERETTQKEFPVNFWLKIQEQIPADSWELIRLYFVDGKTYREIGEMQNLPQTTIKHRIRRSIKLIQRKCRWLKELC